VRTASVKRNQNSGVVPTPRNWRRMPMPEHERNRPGRWATEIPWNETPFRSATFYLSIRSVKRYFHGGSGDGSLFPISGNSPDFV